VTVARESVTAKAHRYLIEGRLVVSRVAAGVVRAHVRGDGSIHELGVDDGRWWCSCPARSRCSHLVALGSVVAVDRSSS